MSKHHINNTLRITSLERARDIISKHGRGHVDLACFEVLGQMIEEIVKSIPEPSPKYNIVSTIEVPITPTPAMLVALWQDRDEMRGQSENRIARRAYYNLVELVLATKKVEIGLIKQQEKL